MQWVLNTLLIFLYSGFTILTNRVLNIWKDHSAGSNKRVTIKRVKKINQEASILHVVAWCLYKVSVDPCCWQCILNSQKSFSGKKRKTLNLSLIFMWNNKFYTTNCLPLEKKLIVQHKHNHKQFWISFEKWEFSQIQLKWLDSSNYCLIMAV